MSSAEPPPGRPHPALRLDREGPVLTLTLDDPAHRNAQVPSLWRALAETAEAIDPDVRVVVIRAEGPSFSAGLDRRMFTPVGVAGEPSLLELAGHGATALEASIERFQLGFTAWGQIPAVTIASVQGHAIGAGCQLALACDLRVVADDVAFALRETSLGLVPDLAGTAPLVHLVGPARALEICATGRFVHAEEAVRIGLAQLSVAPAELGAATRDLAEVMLQAPPEALRELKPLLRQATHASASDQQRAEREAQARLLTAMVDGAGK